MHAAVDGILHPQLFGARVHQLHEGLRRPGHRLRHRHRRVVGRVDGDRLHHLAERERLAFLQVDLRAAHLARLARGDDRFVPVQLPVAHAFGDQQHEHHLGHRRRRRLAMRILLEQDPPRGGVDENGPPIGLRRRGRRTMLPSRRAGAARPASARGAERTSTAPTSHIHLATLMTTALLLLRSYQKSASSAAAAPKGGMTWLCPTIPDAARIRHARESGNFTRHLAISPPGCPHSRA